jgi:hypothetical protein
MNELGMGAHACNSSSWETKAGGLSVQGQHRLHSKFQVSLGNTVRPCLKKWHTFEKTGIYVPSPEHYAL